jgi:hypothetical protein
MSRMQLPSNLHVIGSTEAHTRRFLERLFSKVSDETDFSTWEHTLEQMCNVDIPEIFFNWMNKFLKFVNAPSLLHFNQWIEEVQGEMEDSGVFDDWNISNMFLALITAKYRDLAIVDESSPIVPFRTVEEVSDTPYTSTTSTFECPRAFVTVVLAIASCAGRNPSMAHVAEELLGKAESALDEDEEDEDE